MINMWIVCVMNKLLAVLSSCLIWNLYHARKKLKVEMQAHEKDTRLFFLSELWILVLQNGLSVSEYFERRNVYRIIVYGAGRLGKRLLRELELAGKVEVVGFIDRRDIYYFYGIQGFKMKDHMPKADMAVITLADNFGDIKLELEKKLAIPVVSLWDILGEEKNNCYRTMGLKID